MNKGRIVGLGLKLIIWSTCSLGLYVYPNLVSAQVLSDSTCKGCHLSQWQAWSKSKHRFALKSLPFHEQRNLKCQSCHNEVGLRQLLQRQYRLKSEPRPKSRLNSNIDCMSCHGSTQFSVETQKHQWTDQVQYRTRARLACASCHSLPPLDSQKEAKNYNGHSLQTIKKP